MSSVDDIFPREKRAAAAPSWMKRKVFGSGLAVSSVALALGFGLLARRYDIHHVQFTVFLFAIALSAWYGRTRAAILAVVSASVVYAYFFAEPLYSFAVNANSLPHYVLFVLFGLLVGWFSAVRGKGEEVLRERARLLDLTHDTVFVRDMQDVITYWNRGAEESYGWTKKEAVGQVSHELTQTIFPVPLPEINAQLLRANRWEGELVHAKRDGTRVVVASRWSLQRDERGSPIAILETNNDVTQHKRAEEAAAKSAQLAQSHVEIMMRSLDVLATEARPEKFIGEMLRTIGRQLRARRVVLWAVDPRDDSLHLRLTIEEDRPVELEPGHPWLADPVSWKSNPLVQEMGFTKAPIVCEDIENDSRLTPEHRHYLLRKGCKRFLIIPMFVLGDLRGFIGIQHDAPAVYDANETELAQALAHHVMMAVHGDELGEEQRQAAILKERARLARDIHDTLAQGFTGVIIQMEAADEALLEEDPEQAVRHVRRARELAREGLNEARRSVHALRPQALEKAGFADALRAIINNTAAGTTLRAEFRIDGEARELGPAVEEHLLHIGQEALTNAIRHARATKFQARLAFEAAAVRLELRDNGDGFVVQSGNGAGIGLIGMKERAAQIGGTLTVSSEPGAGTRIATVAPYQQAR
jgi:PAS domain S-box-containing protein